MLLMRTAQKKTHRMEWDWVRILNGQMKFVFRFMGKMYRQIQISYISESNKIMSGASVST